MTTTTYEFTAYAEQDLLEAGSGNGSNLGCGDSFTMPAGATTCITVKDDDAFLSGDSCHNENADDHWHQTATITGADGTEQGNGGQIYAESYWWVYDQHGNWYVMVEIEQEGSHDDYFTFYSGHGYSVPPAGTHLTVHSACNVKGDWLDYKCLDAGLKWELDDTCTYTIEAEDLALWNFQAVHGDNASGDELIKLACNDGKASTNFGGESGTYNIKICAQDELDGDSVIKVYVNGHEVGVIVLDESQGNNGWGSNNGHFTEFSLDNIEINAGDKIELRAWQDGGEYVRIDKIAFEQVKGGDLEGRVFCDTDCDGLEVTTTTEPGCDYTIEAEHMHKWGFTTVHGDKASGGALAKLQNCYGGGDLWTHFNGKNGTYDLKIFAQDESDGQSEIFVKINGHKVAVVKLDRDTDGYGNDNGHFSEFVVPNVKINHGDQIKLWVDGNSGEWARIDRIELEGKDTIVTTPEPGKEGVLVTLTDLDGNAILDDHGNAITTLTDADGNYKFQNIDAGDYRVKFSNPDGTEFTFQNVGSDDRIDSDVDADGLSDVFTIKAGETTGDVDAGLKEVKLGSLSGRYFCDENRDGLDNDGLDKGVGGVLVELLDENGNPTERTTTTSTDPDTLGNYSFDDLEAGTYGVRFIDEQTGKVLTTQNVDGDVSDDIDSDATALQNPGESQITGIVVTAGNDTPDNDAGVITAPASISGAYFNDADRNGVNDDGLPLGGRTVTLVDTNGNPVLDIDGNPVDPVLTEADGSYTFENLAPGDYVVMFEAPQAGEEFTDPDSANGDDTNDSDVIDAANGKTATVSVVAGQDAENVDAGVREAPGAITGVYFSDADGNDVNDDGVPLGGRTVTLVDTNGDPVLDIDGNAIDPVLTEADGSYIFDNLAAGDYVVMFEGPQAGEEFVAPDSANGDDTNDSDVVDALNGKTAPVVVVAGETTENVDAGVSTAPASISGSYFNDADRNGVNDDGLPLGGRTVTLVDTNGNPVLDIDGNAIDPVLTEADGSYTFENLAPGDYVVMFEAPQAGEEFTDPDSANGDDTNDSDVIDAANGKTATVSVVAGQDAENVDAGVREAPGAITGVYFSDADGNDVNDDGVPLGGRTVTLVDTNGDPVLDIDGNAIDPVLTEADGSYIFDNLAAGDYVVMFEGPQAGEEFVAPDSANGDDTNDSDVVDALNGKTAPVVVVAGETTENVDAGVSTAPASISGSYFNDADRNGVNDDGLPLGGRTVTLVDTNGNPVLDIDGNAIDPVLTEADGSYTFENLAPGDYVVMFEAPQAGEEFTDPDSANGDDTNDSDVIDAANGKTATVSVVAGQDAENVDAGVREAPGAITGVYFSDADGNDVNDDGVPLGGRTVTLVDTNGDPVLDIDGNAIDPVLTEADGSYIFDNLAAGDYVVMFEGPQAGEEFVAPDSANGDDTNDSDVVDALNGKTAPVVVVAGETTENVDAGVSTAPASISGAYFNDADRNGVNDDGLPLGGRTVTLVDTNGNPVLDIDGNPVDPVLTEADGSYTFENLAPGDYVVMFEAPQAGEEFTDPDSANGDDTNDSDVIDAANGKTATVSVVAGQDAENVDAGVVELPGSLSGRYFCDENRDGTELDDNGNPEVGVGGVLVTLLDASGNPVLDANGIPVTTTTDSATGNYQFTGLVAGTYGVLFADAVSGKTLIAPDVNGNANDDIDSDAISIIDPTSGLSEITGIQVNAGQDTPDNDAGVENLPPEIDDESGEVCYDETVTIDLIDVNDIDPEGAALNLIAIDGIDVTGLNVGESFTLADTGVIITLGADGDIIVDGEAAVIGGQATADLLADESAVDTFTYTLSDGSGGTDTANVEVTFKGATDSIDKVAQILTDQGLLGNEICFQLTNGPDLKELFTMQITGTGNPLLDGIFAEAYCVAVAEPLQTGQGGLDFSDAPELKGTLHLALPGMIPNDSLNPIFPGVGVGVNGEAAEDNLDLVNWIINQDFGSVDNGDGTSTTYTDAEIQGAIWGLTDGFAFVNGEGGTQDNALEIIEFALNDQDMDGVGAADQDGFDEGGAEGFEPLVGDKVALFLDPTAGTEALGHSQPFIFAVDLFEACEC